MKKIKKMLFVTKFEELGYDALQSMLTLRNAALEHVIFLYAIEREKVAMHRGLGYQKEEEVRLRESANIRFIDWAENLFEQGMEAGVYIVVGNMVSEVIKAASAEKADLIVIGKSGKGILEQLYSGSDVMELIKRSSIPVQVFKHGPEKQSSIENPFERLLLATDWSPASIKAVDYFKGFKNVTEEIHVVHVVNEKDLKGPSSYEVQEIRKQARRKLEDIEDIFETEGIKTRSHVYVGDPAQEIDKAAREYHVSMIALGSSGKRRWTDRWLGGIPQKIAEKSAYHTLLIPPDRQ